MIAERFQLCSKPFVTFCKHDETGSVTKSQIKQTIFSTDLLWKKKTFWNIFDEHHNRRSLQVYLL